MAAILEFDSTPDNADLEGLLRDLASHADVGQRVRALIDAGLDALPLPGGGATLERWRRLEQVGRHDLCLAKIYESHTDAIAILAEIEPRTAAHPKALHAVWASESPTAPLRARAPKSPMPIRALRAVTLEGSKAWCSGARFVDRGLVTVVDDRGARCLALVSMDAPGITVVDDRWQAVGMRDSATAEIVFDDVPATLIGPPNAYLDRKGFWHGGAGVAACWYGAAAHVGTRARDLQIGRKDVHARAHLGTIDALLAGAASLLRECAAAIDRDPARSMQREVMRLRAAVADCCERVLAEAMHALGPGPFCKDRRLAALAADLPVFVRQVRSEHDRVAQAEQLLGDEHECAAAGWPL